MRKPFVITNWKINKNVDEALNFLDAILSQLPDSDRTEVGIAPQAFAIYPMVRSARKTDLQIIGQNAAEKCNGAYTGEISVRDLASMGVNYVMLGHAEQRHYFKESNQSINRKILTALREGVKPIVCTNGERKNVGGDNVFSQLENVLAGVPAYQLANITLSFEPTAAIGAGNRANIETAERGCWLLRQEVRRKFGGEVAEHVRIFYGGSVNPNNIGLIMAAPNVDGVLIGRASLDAGSFAQMMNYQQTALSSVI